MISFINTVYSTQHNHNDVQNLPSSVNQGMSISTVTAARIYKGQKFGKMGEEEQLVFDRFPYSALSRVKRKTTFDFLVFFF